MKKNLTSLIVLLMLMVSNCVSAATITHDISTGNLIISGNSKDNYIVIGSTTSHYVIAEFGYKGTITLKNVYFNFSGSGIYSPIRIMGMNNMSNTDPNRTNVNIVLDGDNYIYNTGGGRACIQVDQGAQINISAIDPCDDASGTLVAEQANQEGGAAIGSLNRSVNSNETLSTALLSNGQTESTAGGNVVVSSGMITARGGHGAGIGGGYGYNYVYYDGMIVIYGGVVNARTIRHSAGIGSGCPYGSGVVPEYAPNSAVVVLPPAVISAAGAGSTNFVEDPDLALAGTKVRVYLGDPNQPTITVKTVDNNPSANIYFDLSQDPDINRVVSTLIDPTILNINGVLLGQTDARGIFTTTGSLTNPTTFFTDATTSAGNLYFPKEERLPNGGNIELGIMTVDINMNQTPSSMLGAGYTTSEAQSAATVLKIMYNDSKPMTDLVFDWALGNKTPFDNPIFYYSDSATIIPAPTMLKKGDVYYVSVPIKLNQEPKLHSDVFRISGKWDGSSTGYIRQVITQIVADLRIVNICQGDSYVFDGQVLTESGVYVDTTTITTSCSSGVSINDGIRLNVHAPQTHEIYDTVCGNNTYIWAGETFTKSGVYTKNFASIYGCDSTVTLHLTVGEVYDITIYDTICVGETYTWDGRTYTKTGVYPHKYLTVTGCDSIVTLNLLVGDMYNVEFRDTICNGEAYSWNTQKYTTTGSYTQSLTTQHGCDSIVTLHLIVGDLYNVEWTDTICEGETYTWNSEIYTKAGSYTQSFVSQYGCDSTVTLHLIVGELYDHAIYDTICVGESYTWDGVKYYTTGVYPRKYLSRYGCDSLVTLHLIVGEKYNLEFSDTICNGEVYVWNSQKYTTTGSYTQSFTTQYGCDSIVTVHLFVAPIPQDSYAEAVCQGEPYRFGNRILTKTGIYVDTALSMYGCDSITTLTLRIHEPYLIDQYIEVCNEDTFTFRGMLIEGPGIYYDSMLTQHGCDSVYRLIYNKTPTYLFHSEDTMCVGATYTYRGKEYTSPGTYYDSLTTVSGCDSIYCLVLHTYPTYLIYTLQTEDVCADAPTYEMVVQYDGVRPSHYNLLYSQKAKEQGFKDIVQAPFISDTLNLPIPHATPYIRPDYYNVTLELTNTTCPTVSSEYETQLLIRYPSWIIEQNWQDVVAAKKAQYNGGYHFEAYDWHVNNVSAAQSKSYLYMPSLREGDEVVLYATRQGEDYAIPTCPVIIEAQNMYTQEYPVPVYPTRLSRADRNITILSSDSEYYIYDMFGRLIVMGDCRDGEKTLVELPSISGSYFVMLLDEQQNKQVVHVLVE
jgi:hypothetical protein